MSTEHLIAQVRTESPNAQDDGEGVHCDSFGRRPHILLHSVLSNPLYPNVFKTTEN